MMSWRYQIIPLSIATPLIRLPLAIRMLLIVLSSGIGLEKNLRLVIRFMYLNMQLQMILSVSGKKSYQAALVIPVKNHLKSYLSMMANKRV